MLRGFTQNLPDLPMKFDKQVPKPANGFYCCLP